MLLESLTIHLFKSWFKTLDVLNLKCSIFLTTHDAILTTVSKKSKKG